MTTKTFETLKNERLFQRNPLLYKVKSCLEKGLDINEMTHFGYNLINSAVAKGDYETAKLLLDNGANPNILPKVDYTPLMRSIIDGDNKMAELLLEYGADINMQDDFGMNALMLAATSENGYIFKKLIEFGADLNQKNIDGKSIVSYIHTVDILEVLEEKLDGLDEHIQDEYEENRLKLLFIFC